MTFKNLFQLNSSLLFFIFIIESFILFIMKDATDELRHVLIWFALSFPFFLISLIFFWSKYQESIESVTQRENYLSNLDVAYIKGIRISIEKELKRLYCLRYNDTNITDLEIPFILYEKGIISEHEYDNIKMIFSIHSHVIYYGQKQLSIAELHYINVVNKMLLEDLKAKDGCYVDSLLNKNSVLTETE